MSLQLIFTLNFFEYRRFMRSLFAAIVILLIIVSCAPQKETVKKEEEKPVVVIEKKKEYSFDFEQLKSGVNSSLRGISVVDSNTIWASGSKGIFLRSTDGGKTWSNGKVKGYETLDFRDVEAFDKNTAILMCADAPAYFFKTTDGGKSWKRKYMNRNAKIFFDAMAFWDEKKGIALSDPIDDKFVIVKTTDGGESWREISSMNIPTAQKNESAFAASGSALAVSGTDYVWFGTGGTAKPRIFFSEDAGENWRTIDASFTNGNSSSGIFSMCFKDELNGIAVGGDYKNDKNNSGNCAISGDGGLSWTPISANQPGGYRSCVAWDAAYNIYLTTGTSGSDYSIDDGKTWAPINNSGYNTIGISKKDGSCFIAGDNGNITKVKVTVK